MLERLRQPGPRSIAGRLFIARCNAPPAAQTKASAVPPKIPLRDFFKNPVSRSYDLSPDGETLSFLQPWESRMNIFIRPVAALKKRGVDVEYMVKDNEGHGFHNEENRFDFYGAMEKYLKPAA